MRDERLRDEKMMRGNRKGGTLPFTVRVLLDDPTTPSLYA
jgi:hypothetical protein